REPNLRVAQHERRCGMAASADRLFFSTLNACWGATIGAAAVLTQQTHAWAHGTPTRLLVADATVVLFGVGFALASRLRGRRLTLRGAMIAAAGAVVVYSAATLAVTAPGWAVLLIAAAGAGLVCGLVWPFVDSR